MMFRNGMVGSQPEQQREVQAAAPQEVTCEKCGSADVAKTTIGNQATVSCRACKNWSKPVPA